MHATKPATIGAGRVHHVYGDPIHHNTQVHELVQPGLQRERVKDLPVGDQLAKPALRRAALPRAVGARWHPRRAQPAGQLIQGRAVQHGPERFSVGSGGSHDQIMAHPRSGLQQHQPNRRAQRRRATVSTDQADRCARGVGEVVCGTCAYSAGPHAGLRRASLLVTCAYRPGYASIRLICR